MRIVEWSGTRAVDENGKDYIDLTAGGIFAAMFGPGSWVIKRAIDRVDHFCSYAPRFGNYWRDRYYELLRDFTGFECAVAFCEGSTAVEAFWRAARVYTGKPGIWGGLCDPDDVGKGGKGSPSDQFHGWTLGAMIAAGKMNWPELGVWPELGAGRFGGDPNRTACMIMEPYHAASGQFHRIAPTINRVKEMKQLYPDVLFCIDEIQGGFGRTGKLWAHEHYDGLKPEFVTIGKLAFGGFPGAALLGPAEVMESDSVKEFGHLHSTHSGHPLVCSVGCAVIEEMIAQDLINESARKGEILHGYCGNFDCRTHHHGGLLAGVEFKSRHECAQAVGRCAQRGILVVDTGRQWIKIGPALTIEDADLCKACDVIKEVIEEVIHERQSDTAPRGDPGEEPRGISGTLPEPGLLTDGAGGNAPNSENAGCQGTGD